MKTHKNDFVGFIPWYILYICQ